MSFRLDLSNPTLPEITDGYEIQLHHALGHDLLYHGNGLVIGEIAVVEDDVSTLQV